VQVAPAHLGERVLLVHFLPAVDPLIRPDEGDLGSLRRSLAELGEEERETRAQPLLGSRAHALHHFRSQLVAKEALAVERVPDRRANRLHLFASDLRVDDAGRIPPGAQFAAALRRRVGDGPTRRMPEGQLTRGVQMKSSSQRPGLDQEPPSPERVPEVGLGDLIDTCSELKLRGGLDLRVNPAELASDVDESVGPCSLSQEAAGQSPGANLVPGCGNHQRILPGPDGRERAPAGRVICQPAGYRVTFLGVSVVSYLRGLNPRLPRAVWALELGGVVNSFGNGFVYPFLFIYLHNVRGFGLGISGLVVASNAGVALLAGTPGGAAADRFGAKRTLALSLALLVTAFALFPLVRAPWHAFCLAALVGLANGVFWPSYHTLLAAITPADRRHAGYALQRVSTNLGFGVGGALAGLIAVSARPGTFTALFLIDAATYAAFLALLAIVPGGRFPREDRRDSTGYRAALRDHVFLALLGVNIVFVTAGYAQLETLPVFAKNEAHVSERAIGLVFLVNSLVIVLAQLPVTKLVEGRRRMSMLGLMTVLWAAAWLLVFGAGLWLSALAAAALIVVAGGVFAVGECLQGPTQQALIAELAPDHLRGRYMALSTSSWSIGWIAGPALGAYVLQQEPLALWPAAAALCLLAGAGGLLLERRLPAAVRRTPADLTGVPPLEPPGETGAEPVTAKASG
jgi:MFS family permease